MFTPLLLHSKQLLTDWLNSLNTIALLLLLGAAAILLPACNPTQHLADDEILHGKTKIKIDATHKVPNESQLSLKLNELTRPQPNDKLFNLFRFKLWIYNITKKNDDGAGSWLSRNLGEAPVLLDTTKLTQSTKVLHSYLFNHGYFENKVSYSTSLARPKLAKVTYEVELRQPFRLDTISYPPDTSTLTYYLNNALDKNDRLIEKGQIFDVDKLTQERNRLTYHLRSRGYFNLSQEALHFKVDSSHSNRTVNLFLDINAPEDTTLLKHQQYRIKNVYIHTQYEPEAVNYKVDTAIINGFHFIRPDKIKLRPAVITNYLLVKPNTLYSQRDHETSVKHMLELGAFKFVNIRYRTPLNQANLPADSTGMENEKWLNAYVYLSPAKKMQISAEIELNNREQNQAITRSLLGTALNLNYNNRNTFKGAEALAVNLFGGVELAPGSDTLLLNTIDVSAEASLRFPKFLVPFKISNLSRIYQPRSQIRLGVNYIRRVNLYTLNSYNVLFGYDWQENQRKRHLLNPVAISLLTLPNTTASFDSTLAQSTLLRASFDEQVILGANYAYIFSNPPPDTDLKNFIYFRGSIETAGNLMSLINATVASSEEPIKIFGNNFSQYVRTETELRYYTPISTQRSMVYRLFAGVGIPYNNSEVLPYIKQFFVGGPTSMRGFPIRGVGPGKLPLADGTDVAVTEFDRTGELRLEANAEYRFTLYDYVKAAAFVDAGNIWLLKEDTLRPGGVFKGKDFYKSIAISTGAGIRLDFNYFVMRLDTAFPIYDPRLNQGDRWVVKQVKPFNKAWRKNQLVFNLAIGYPF